VRAGCLQAAVVVVALASASAPAWGDGGDLVGALGGLPAGDLVRFAAHRVGQPVQLELAARVRAPMGRVVALLADPEAYRRAVPSFVRADLVRSEPGDRGGPPARLVAWELEIPLWNLTGTLWLRPRADGAALELAGGDLAPGRFQLSVAPAEGGCTLLMRGGADLRNANWITRRLAARHAHAEPAMAAAAAYVLLRALALEAERGASVPAAAAARWPRAPLRAPELDQLDGRGLAATLARARPLAAGEALAVVQSRSDGRLRWTQVAVRAPLPVERLQPALARPASWQALPGWREVTARADPAGAGRWVWQVDAWLPFVDFDAQWWVTPLPRFRAAARAGDWQGAVFGWDLLPGADGAGCLAVFSSHPRVDQTGYLPRKLIEAEPLLEHGLALGLAYVNALALLDAIGRHAR
jgi:hypothetical protein